MKMNEDTNAATDGKRQNEPAFPVTALEFTEPDVKISNDFPGITRLEYFAAAVIAGGVVNGTTPKERAKFVFDEAEAHCSESQRRAQ